MLKQGIDIHAHILPQTDDGSESWDESAKMMRIAASQGFTHIIATPHFRQGQDIELLKNKVKQLNENAVKMGLDLEICLGQEILYFEEMLEYLQKGEASVMADSDYVLVEFMPEDSFQRILRAVRQLIQSGYFPIIAHGERYQSLRKKGRLEELIQAGALIQMNYRSLEGSNFDRDVRWCRKQVLKGYIHFLGTDMHHARHRPPIIEDAEAWLRRHGVEALLNRLTRDNPQCIVYGQMMQAVSE